MKRIIIFVLSLSLISLSCQTVYRLQSPKIEPTHSPGNGPTIIPSSSVITTIPPSPTLEKITDIKERLRELGGKPCKTNMDFTCVTLTVPLDHFDPNNRDMIDVVFAIAPATGERKGLFVQAFPGGPGGKGISYASRQYFPREVNREYDIVFFDQRGLGLSNPLECKKAYADYFLQYLNADDTIGEEGYDTPQEQQAAIQEARFFVDRCVKEIGIDPAKLKFFTTDQVAEDIESLRQAIDDDKFMLYGVSYGTSVAQAYARSHADHLAGLILDGVQDTTLSGDEIAFSQWEAANMVLSEVFKACDADRKCSSLMGGRAQDAYDALAKRLADAPIHFEYSYQGKRVKRLFTEHMLDYTASYMLYGIDSRVELMKALAAAKDGDLLPIAKLFYAVSNIDPGTGEYIGDPSFSDTMYYIVWCSDDAYYSGTSQERSARLMQAGQKLNGLIPRLDLDVMPLGLACAFLPSAPTFPTKREPLKAEGVPTLVLNATLDPATPYQEGESVFENLQDGYHIYVEGGIHGIYGRGFNCPDQYVNDFLEKGLLPDQRQIVCDWGASILGQ